MALTTSLNLRALALAGALLLAAPVAAKTDIGGCVSSATRNQWGEASMIWYVPGTGEVCELLDCGGGRAPPKTNVPGCGNYKGTAEYQPTFLPGFGASGSDGAEATATETAKNSGSGSGTATATGLDESASPKPTNDDKDTTMLTGTRNPPPVTSPATTTTKAAATGAATQSEASTSTRAVAPSGGSTDEESDAASATSPSAGAGAMPTAAPLGMFIGLIAGAVLF